jgi:O-antigen/teichoic acid export membrane protein
MRRYYEMKINRDVKLTAKLFIIVIVSSFIVGIAAALLAPDRYYYPTLAMTFTSCIILWVGGLLAYLYYRGWPKDED